MKAELRLLKGAFQQADELGAKEPAEHFDRKEELPATINPARIARGEAPAGDHAMKMRMMVQVLSPGMEHRHKSDLRAEVFRVGANLEQRLRRGFEETAVNQPLVLERQWAQGLR
jgi:hypothetical protein